MTATQLAARDVRRSFKIGPRRIEVLRGISLDVTHGEAVFLCGPSGAGKTTLLYTLAGLERPESGSVEFEGRRLYSGNESSQAKLAKREDGFRFPGIFLAPGIDRAGKCHAAGNDRAANGTIGRGKESGRRRTWRSSAPSAGRTIRRRAAASGDCARSHE